MRAGLLLTAVALALSPAGEGRAQSASQRTPNLGGTWSAAQGVVQFNFIHRFEMSDPPLRKVANTPTFLVATGITDRISGGVVYGPNSDLVRAYPNEWELFARVRPLSREAGAPLDLTIQGGWNVAAESADAELTLARGTGPLRFLLAGRFFHHGYYADRARWAAAGGAVLRLAPWLSLAGDYGALLDRRASERAAWGAGVQIGVPYTPHSLSLHASNVGTNTLEGASRGARTRWGFEYTVPITLSRYRPTHTTASAPPGEPVPVGERDPSASPAERADTVRISIEGLKYRAGRLEVAPGTTVVWVNEDPVPHTVTAEDETYDSGALEPGASWSHTFTEVGTYAYHCTPHPFMKAVVLVVEPGLHDGSAS